MAGILYLDAVKDVGGMINDPDVVAYKARIQLHLLRAMSDLLLAEGFTEADFPDCVKLKTNLVFSSNPYNGSEVNLIRVLEIYPDPLTAGTVRVAIKNQEEWAAISYNSEMSPAYDEVFINQIGNSLKAVVASPSKFTLASDTLYMKYVSDVNDEEWTDATDFQQFPTAITAGNLVVGQKYIISNFVAASNFSNVKSTAGNGYTGEEFMCTNVGPPTNYNGSTLNQVYMYSKEFIRAAIQRATETIKATDIVGE